MPYIHRITAAVASAMLAFPACSVAQPLPAAGFEVVRLGDGQLSCEELMGQINGLTAEGEAAQASAAARANAAQQATAQRAQNGATARRLGFGALSAGLAYVPFAGGLASYAVRGAAMNAANAAAYGGGAEVVQVNAPAASPVEPPQLKRAAHLKDIFARKAC